MNTQARKAKGRRLQKQVAQLIINTFKLEPDDVQWRSMGANGEDIILSPRARKFFDVSIECKNTERFNAWKAIEQSRENCGDHIPLVVFSKNREKTYVIIELEHLLGLWEFASSRIKRTFDLGNEVSKE